MRRASQTIAVKLSCLLFLTVLLPTLLIQTTFVRIYNGAIDNYVNTYLLNAFESVFNDIDRCFEDMRAQANYLFVSNTLRESARHSFTGNYDRTLLDDYSAIQETFSRCSSLHTKTGMNYTFLVNDGRIFGTWGPLQFPAKADWLDQITGTYKTKNGNTWFVLHDKEDECGLKGLGQVIAVSKKVSVEPFAAIIVSVDQEVLQNYCVSIPGIRSSSSILLVDENNEVLFSTEGNHDLQEFLPFLQTNHSQKNVTCIKRQSSKYLLTRQFGFNGWKMIQLFDDSKETIVAGHLRGGRLLAVIILATLTLAGIMFLVVYHMTRNIRNLDDAVKVFSDTQKPKYLEVKGHDEVSTLTYHFNEMQRNTLLQVQKIQQNEKEKMHLLYEAQLSEMNPHFLYNTLNSIRWVAMFSNAQNVADLLESLGILLRNYTSKANEKILLSEEISALKHYMNLQYARYGEVVCVHYAIDENTQNCLVPKLCLQPLVENSLIHGFEHQQRKGMIEVKSVIIDDNLELTITDNGIGIETERLLSIREYLTMKDNKKTEKNHSIGLKNIHSRIQYLFGEIYGINIESVQGVGTKVRIRIPARYQDGGV